MVGGLIIIGGGNMGTAFASLCLNKGLLQPESLTIVEHNSERQAALKTLGCQIVSDIPDADDKAVLISVKPQDMQQVCADLREKITPKTLVISIMAGVQITALKEALDGHSKIVRCMPNTPLKIGFGMTGFYPSPDLSEDELTFVKNILTAGGAFLRVANEDDLDGVTALSGSGPAYVFYFIEAFIQAAKDLGFSNQDAELMAAQTISGSLELWKSSGESPAALREKVTSKGGTTAAALSEFEARNVSQGLQAGIKKAQLRSIELR